MSIYIISMSIYIIRYKRKHDAIKCQHHLPGPYSLCKSPVSHPHSANFG